MKDTLTDHERLGCSISDYNWNSDDCPFLNHDDQHPANDGKICQAPYARMFVYPSLKEIYWKNKARYVSVHALESCPLLSLAQERREAMEDPKRRVWRGNDLVPIKDGRLDWGNAHHYRRPPLGYFDD